MRSRDALAVSSGAGAGRVVSFLMPLLVSLPVSLGPWLPAVHGDLVHHWPLDETRGLAAQDVVTGNAGELVNFFENDDLQWVDGQFGGALALSNGFDIDRFVEVDLDGVDASVTGGFTVAMWINPGEAILNPGEYQLLSTPGDAIGFTIMNAVLADGTVHDRVLLFWDGNIQTLHVGTTTLEPGTWYHVAITSTGIGGEKRYFIDGEPEEKVLFDPSRGGTDGVEPGTRNGWGPGKAQIGAIDGQRTHGSIIDDVRIYDQALTAGEIQAIIDNPPPPVPEITIISPQPGDVFHDPAVALEFEGAPRAAGASIPASGIKLILNGADVSADLTLAGDGTAREALYDKLEPDTTYEALIEVTDTNGTTSRRRFTFATLSPPEDPDLLHYWALDETSGLTAIDLASGANADLVNFEGGDDAWWVEGKVDGALDLGADATTDNYASIDLPAFDSAATGGFTIAMWVKPGARILSPGEYQLFSTPGDSIGFTIMNGTRDGRRHDRVLLFWDGSLPDLHVGTTTLEPGNWYHVAIVSNLDTNEKLYYVNGRLDEQVLFAPSQGGTEGIHPVTRTGWPDGVAEIGGIGGAGRTHDSVIDDVRIYSVALEEEDIQQLVGELPAEPLELSGFMPARGDLFHDPADGFGFRVVSPNFGATIPPANIRVTLNGEDISAALTVAGGERDRTVSFDRLDPETFYDVSIDATDTRGAGASASYSFATFTRVEEGLRHRWKMDETSGLVAADSILGRDAALAGFELDDDSQWVAGPDGGALDLGSDDTRDNFAEMQLPALDASETGGYTIAMWVNPGEEILEPGEYQLLSTPGDAVGFTIMNAVVGDRVHDRVLLFWDGSLPGLHVGTTTLEPGTWYHVAITSTGTRGRKLYFIDGEPEEQQLFDPATGGIEGLHIGAANGWPAGTARIGAITFGDGVPQRTHGSMIDDVRIYDIALDEARIAALAAAEPPPPPGGARVPGDCNTDSTLNISDPVCLLGFLFQGNPAALPCGDGSQADPGNTALMDANGDASVNLSDAVWLLNFLFGGGPAHVLAVAGEEQTACVPIEGCTAADGCQ